MIKKKVLYSFIYALFILTGCKTKQNEINHDSALTDSLVKLEMSLSAFGVESDSFPSIEAEIDFLKGTANCRKSFYNPKFRDSSYSLNTNEIEKIIRILNEPDFKNLNKDYSVDLSDQPTSTMTIYSVKQKLTIKDYGLRGPQALQELYKIVYKY